MEHELNIKAVNIIACLSMLNSSCVSRITPRDGSLIVILLYRQSCGTFATVLLSEGWRATGELFLQ